MAGILDWAAVEYPYRFISWGLLFAAVNQLTDVPADDDPHVRRFRASIGDAKAHLHRCRRAMVAGGPRGELGVRATVDSADLLKNVLYKPVERLQRAVENAALYADLVDINSIPKTDENRGYVEWFRSKVLPAIGVAAKQFGVELLPPRSVPVMPPARVAPMPPRREK